MQEHARERIEAVGIEAARDRDELRPEALDRRDYDAFHRVRVGRMPTARQQRHVGDVAQQTETHRLIGQAMVPGRPRHGIRIAKLAAHDGIDGMYGETGRDPRDLVAAATERGIRPELAAAGMGCGRAGRTRRGKRV